MAARRFRWEAIVDDQPVVTAAVNWLMCEVELDPPWTLGEKKGERFEVEITGDPDVSLTFKGLQPETVEEGGLKRNPGGVVATANHCISAIPYVCEAGPRDQDLSRPSADRRPGRAAPGWLRSGKPWRSSVFPSRGRCQRHGSGAGVLPWAARDGCGVRSDPDR